jgi:hypothetical protein
VFRSDLASREKCLSRDGDKVVSFSCISRADTVFRSWVDFAQVIEDHRMRVRYRSEFKTISRTWNGQLRYVMVRKRCKLIGNNRTVVDMQITQGKAVSSLESGRNRYKR